MKITATFLTAYVTSAHRLKIEFTVTTSIPTYYHKFRRVVLTEFYSNTSHTTNSVNVVGIYYQRTGRCVFDITDYPHLLPATHAIMLNGVTEDSPYTQGDVQVYTFLLNSRKCFTPIDIVTSTVVVEYGDDDVRRGVTHISATAPHIVKVKDTDVDGWIPAPIG